MIFRSPALLAAVRMLPCMSCGRELRTQPAHSNQLRFGKARSLKASDAAVMALCCAQPGLNGCHEQHDQGGRLTKQQWWNFEYQMIAKTLWRLIELEKLVGPAELIRSIPPAFPSYETAALMLIEHIEAGRLKVAN